MKAATDTEDWRKKYLDSLRSLENEERNFRAMEVTLKRLVGRLCVASLGLSPQLDEELRKLQAVIRRDASQEELEKLTSPLTDAIHALDESSPVSPMGAAQPQVKAQVQIPAVQPESVLESSPKLSPGSSTETIVADERVRALLAAFLAEIKRDAGLAQHADALDAKLADSMTYAQLPEMLLSLTDLVGKRIQRIEQAKQEVEVLLSQMVGKLDEIGQFVAEQNINQTQALASSATLNTRVADEMRAMGESVESASDLQLTRTLVRNRIDSIGRHLQEYREREVERDSVIRVRNEKMTARVTELEAEAAKLQSQLKDEQRLASIDALTQIPNRLAYDKRMEEELKRSQRFGQPACIAAWDIDYFKRINDTYGHRAGDRMLQMVAESLAGRIRGTDFLARYGGEEFVMILSGTKLDAAVHLIDEIRAAVAKLGFHFRGKPVSITMSCGVTALLADDSSSSAFDRADKALYQAKESGRNRCVSK